MTAMAIGYAAMLERFPPAEAVALATFAQEHGFDGTTASDHFQPWLPRQGEASFVWSVLAAIGERTMSGFGCVSTPTFRMHPAVVAQASATLASLYPGRHWLGIGSGDAINEHVVGQRWPEAPERIARMFEAVDVIRKLFASPDKDVRHSGTHFSMESTRLWTAPERTPDIFIATAGPVTAKRAGRVADGLVTVEAPRERLALLLRRFAEGARESGRDPAAVRGILQLHVSWAETEEEAMQNALAEWPNGGMRFPKADIRSPFDFAQIARLVRPEDFAGSVFVSSDPDAHRAHLQSFADLGFERIHLHNVGRNQRGFIETFGRDVLPKVRT